MGEIFFKEFSQFTFFCSIIYIVYILSNFLIKFHGKTVLKIVTTFNLKPLEKLGLLLSFTYIITYIF